MNRLTASGIDRARECVHSFTPDAGPGNTASSPAAAAGTLDHGHIEETIDEAAERAEEEAERAYIEETIHGAADDAAPTPKSDTHRRWLNDFWAHEKHLPWRAEQAFALNPVTGETRQAPIGWPARDYVWAPDGWVPGTADAWCVGPVPELPGVEVLRVPDWKTGQATHLRAPRESGQLALLGLAISRHIGWRGPVSLEYVRVNASRCWVERAIVSRADLLAFQAELVALTSRVAGGEEPRRGHWCRTTFCPQRGRCAATRGLVAASVPALVEAEPFRVALTAEAFVSDAHAAWQFSALDAAEALVREARAALKERARQRPVPLGGGKVYGEVEASRDSFKLDAPGFEDALRKHLGEHASSVIEVKRVVTKGRIEEAARAVVAEAAARGEKAVIKRVNAAVLLELRGIGGLKASPYKKIEVYDAAKVARVAGPENGADASKGAA